MSKKTKKSFSIFEFSQSLFLVLFILIPGILIWFFLGGDISKKRFIPLWALIIIAIFHVLLVLASGILMIRYRLLSKQALNSIIPMVFILNFIITSSDLAPLWRFLVVVILILTLTITTMILTNRKKR